MVRLPLLIAALSAEGCLVGQPRYLLLHQQPPFTEGALRPILREPTGGAKAVYHADAVPRMQAMNVQLIRLPAFPQSERALLDQYALAIRKVISHARQV